MGDGLESVDLAAPHNAACFVPIKARQFIHDLWQIRCNYHIKGSVCKKKRKKKKKTVSMALHYGGEAHEKEFRKIHEGEEGGRKGRGGKMAVGRDEERERDEACIDLSSLPLPHPLPFSNFRSA